MTIEEKRKAIQDKCNSYGFDCTSCELYGKRSVGHCYSDATQYEIVENYKLMFKDDEIRREVLGRFMSKLLPRLTDAIRSNEVDSMRNLLHEVANEVLNELQVGDT